MSDDPERRSLPAPGGLKALDFAAIDRLGDLPEEPTLLITLRGRDVFASAVLAELATQLETGMESGNVPTSPAVRAVLAELRAQHVRFSAYFFDFVEPLTRPPVRPAIGAKRDD